MKRVAISYYLAALSLIVAIVLRLTTGMWLNINDLFVALAGAFLGFAVFKDFALYRDFLTMRTTKHGMSMGLTIVLAVVSLVCINFLANRHNKTWDVTQEKLNSLSDQSVKVAKSLQSDLEVKVFYKGGAAQEERSGKAAICSLIKRSLIGSNPRSSISMLRPIRRSSISMINRTARRPEPLCFLSTKASV